MSSESTQPPDATLEPSTPTLQLKDLARRLPDEIWAIFEPFLPTRLRVEGPGRPPAGDQECLHALLYILVSGIHWEMLPWCFPSYATVRRRLKVWVRQDNFLKAWSQLAERYRHVHGLDWDQFLIVSTKKQSAKGMRRRGYLRAVATERGLPSISPISLRLDMTERLSDLGKRYESSSTVPESKTAG